MRRKRQLDNIRNATTGKLVLRTLRTFRMIFGIVDAGRSQIWSIKNEKRECVVFIQTAVYATYTHTHARTCTQGHPECLILQDYFQVIHPI